MTLFSILGDSLEVSDRQTSSCFVYVFDMINSIKLHVI